MHPLTSLLVLLAVAFILAGGGVILLLRLRQQTAAQIALQDAYETLRRKDLEHQKALAAAEARLPRIAELQAELATLGRQLQQLQADNAALERELAASHVQLTEERKAGREKIALLEQTEARLGKEFENLANRIFEAKQATFREVSRGSVESLLAPVREQLTSFRKRVDEVYDRENRDRASLRTEIQLLKSLNERISTDALNLTRALKGESKTRGNWGEMQLERLLEESGLTQGREYEVQASLKSDQGRRLQPDIVIHLPEQKEVIIDSKVSLVAYEQYHNSDDDDQRGKLLKQHITALRSHCKSLAAKKYDELIGVNSLDLVIMFVPIEPALLLALEQEPALFNEALQIGILLTCPSTLMATLQIINNIWRYEYQNRNAQQIATEAGRLHDHFVRFVEALEKVGEQLKKAEKSYQTAHKRLYSGKGSLVSRSQKLQILGAKTKKKIDRDLLAAADENDPPPLTG